MKKGIRPGFICLITLVCFVLKAGAQYETVAGEISAPYPTITNLAIEWKIKGDDNQNGIVKVKFREKGQTKWNDAMPLRRVPAGKNQSLQIIADSVPGYPDFSWQNKHSGSIFDLKPNTAYEINLQLEDPDGSVAERTIEAKTRPVPRIAKNARITEIEPGSHDTLFTISGSAESPSVYRCSKGKATFKFVDIQNKQWVYVDGLTVNNPVHDGFGICLNGSSDCVVSRCTIDASYGIVAYLPGATNCYISDNVVTGKSVWSVETLYTDSLNQGEGIQITGAGNVICYNKVSNFRDCISFMEDEHAAPQLCNDIYNNDITEATDDGIEADFCFSNCRVMRNRLTNCFVGLSSQPGLGGPNYFIRNVMYNAIHLSFKLQRYSVGDVMLHNTIVKLGTGLTAKSPMDYTFFRNNLAIGGPAGDINWGGWGAGNPYAADIKEPGIHCSFDYDAVGVNGTPYIAKIGDSAFGKVETHGIKDLIMEDVFPGIKFPFQPFPLYVPPDLRPRAGSKVQDAAVIIPNINDHFKGMGPDCGAYEIGEERVHYGPRY